MPGKLKSVNIEEGQHLHKDDPIAELENSDLRARLEIAQAQLKTSEAQLENLKGELPAQIEKARHVVDDMEQSVVMMKAGPREEVPLRRPRA